MQRTLMLVAGARPNFMKVAPLLRQIRLQAPQIRAVLVHTGQHHDRAMSGVFFDELGLPAPDHHLGVGGGSHAQQTARILLAFEALLQRERPDMVAVVGDVDSTLACALAARKCALPVAHIEAGLRSHEPDMPEEINRRATDAISQWCFASEPAALQNLLREGHDPRRVFMVGQWMVDTLLQHSAWLREHPPRSGPTLDFRQVHPRYGVVTLHRPANVDDPDVLARLARVLRRVGAELPLAFAVHPRTRARLEHGALDLGEGVRLLPPLPYREFLHLWSHAAVVLTDSGGLQEETTALGVPCLTLRQSTERPATVQEGSNTLVGTDEKIILEAVRTVLAGRGKAGRRPALWDGQASERTVAQLCRILV